MSEEAQKKKPELDDMVHNLVSLNKRLVHEFLSNVTADKAGELSETYHLFMAGVMQNTEQWLDLHNAYMEKQVDILLSLVNREEGEYKPVVAPERGDRRFAAAEWREHPFFDYIKQNYLLASKWMMEVVETSKLDDDSKKKMAFFTRQYLDAIAPTNFPSTNPEVIKLALETKGESLTQGMKNLIADMERGQISMTDEQAFEVGKNLAITPGAVVYQDELIQLLQYAPATETVGERPLLMVPPCINKYYVLDLQPDNSFVRHALEQGQTVFLVSWRNVGRDQGTLGWDAYVEAVLKAMDVSQSITRAPKINALGFCIGGAILCAALAVLRARKQMPVASVTLLTTLLDYSDPGDLSVFVDEAYVKKREHDLSEGGLMQGRDLAFTFASLRANDLIWYYVINNYLKGKVPDAFDLLYWNSDSTNLPGPMFVYYLRHFYRENRFRVPGALTMCGEKVDLGSINLPTYVLATREDHIVPWMSAYENTRVLKGKIEFVLGASGHIAGVVNPPAKRKRNYWTGGNPKGDARQWLESAQQVPGSWWTHWSEWMKQKAGKQVPARVRLGSEQYPPLEAAPGRYVKQRCE